MKVQLETLEITNYRNIAHATYKFNGNSKIVGENRVGKTNTLEAIVWLLTDKLLNGGTDIASIKPLEDTKREVRVSGTFTVTNDDGTTNQVTIAKEYGEDWVETRGTDDLVFKGHYLNYWYNGTPQKTKKDFYALLNSDFNMNVDEFRGIELLRLLVDPLYIGELGESDSWKDLRTFIINLIGDVSDADVFAKEPSTKIIANDLSMRLGRVDEVRKYYNNISKTIKEELIGIDSNIKMLEETPKPTEDELEVAKAAIEQGRANISKLQSDMQSDAMVIAIDKQINEKQARMNDLFKKAATKDPTKDLQVKQNELNSQYTTLLGDKAKATQDLRILESKLESLENDVKARSETRNTYLTRLKEIDDAIKEIDAFESICPTCHRPLDGKELEDAKSKYLIGLENEKNGILEKGRANKNVIINLASEIELCKKSIEDTKLLITDLKNKADSVILEIETVSNKIKEYGTTPLIMPDEYYDLEKEIAALKTKRAQVIADNNALDVAVREKIQAENERMEQFQKVIDDYNYACRQLEVLEEKRIDKVEKCKELASIEQRKVMVDLFIKTKLEMLDERVSEVFGNIKFQLIKENINGGYDPVCKPYIYNTLTKQSTNTSWRSGSKSEKVTTGVAIAEKIKSKLGLVDFPFLFDEGGEISSETFATRFDTNSQLICVKVQDNIIKPMVMDL